MPNSGDAVTAVQACANCRFTMSRRPARHRPTTTAAVTGIASADPDRPEGATPVPAVTISTASQEMTRPPRTGSQEAAETGR